MVVFENCCEGHPRSFQGYIATFLNVGQKMWVGTLVKVKNQQQQDILHFPATVWKLILGSIGTPLTTYKC